jgi:hypothetical protein
VFTPFSRLLVPIASLVVLCVVSRWVAPAPSAAQQPVTPSNVQQSYVGSNQCFTCHRQQASAWDQTRHMQAFTNMPEKYRSDPGCLKCHVTGFDKPGGFVAGAEKDQLHVGCEACHGPGALHLSAAQRFILALPGEEAQAEKELRESVVKTPSDSVCAECHITQAHHKHPWYEGSASATVGSRAAPAFNSMQLVGPHFTSTVRPGAASRYSIKTCGGCHYEEYKQWQGESHSALSALLPARYTSDTSCQSCHAAPGLAAERMRAAASAGHAWVGAACENCHGPGLDHVGFNRPLIGRLSLTAESEQASRSSIRQSKPPSTCIQCHLGERHQSHPEFSMN